MTQIKNFSDEKRAIAIRLRALRERAVAMPEHKQLLEKMAAELSAYLDKIELEEAQLAQKNLFEVRGESDDTPKKIRWVMPAGMA